MLQFIKQDKKLQLLLFTAFLIQCWFGYYQIGFFHPDQHFQIIEFSSYQLHKPSYATSIWEFDATIRPTLQVYLFSGFRLLCNALGITDNFIIVRLIQIITGLLIFYLFNCLAFFYLKNESKKVLYWVLIFLNFSWCFPFVKQLYSSEVVGSLLFFTALLYYQRKENKTFFVSTLTGFLLALSFYARFQIAFALVGFGVWLLLISKNYESIVHLAIGFAVGIFINALLDYFFYKQWVFTPYNYYQKNIVEGVANSFGTSSFINYILILACVVLAPLYSIALFVVGLKATIKNIKHPLVLSVLFFVVGHCLVGHKEERFLYPIFFALPIIIGFQLQFFFIFYEQLRGFGKMFFGIIKWMGLVLNTFLLFVFSFTPYSQTVYFNTLLQEKFKQSATTILYVDRTSLQTESGLKMEYYQAPVQNITYLKISSVDSLLQHPNIQFFATTFNQLSSPQFKQLERLGFTPCLSSSAMLWAINEFLMQKGINTINDIWMLYERK
jgi:GPI mannosyltransferase 3